MFISFFDSMTKDSVCNGIKILYWINWEEKYLT
jgi:hypothetical protein